MQKYLLTLFITINCFGAHSENTVNFTQYGTWPLTKTPSQEQLTEQDVFHRIFAASDAYFCELSNKKPHLDDPIENSILQAFMSSEKPREQLLTLTAQAYLNEWKPVYKNILEELIQLLKN